MRNAKCRLRNGECRMRNGECRPDLSGAEWRIGNAEGGPESYRDSDSGLIFTARFYGLIGE